MPSLPLRLRVFRSKLPLWRYIARSLTTYETKHILLRPCSVKACWPISAADYLPMEKTPKQGQLINSSTLRALAAFLNLLSKSSMIREEQAALFHSTFYSAEWQSQMVLLPTKKSSLTLDVKVMMIHKYPFFPSTTL